MARAGTPRSRKAVSTKIHRRKQERGGARLIHEHCAIYTKPEVAEAILDWIGWRSDVDLSDRRLLEPSCGNGSFLIPAVRRLIQSAKARNAMTEAILADAIVAFEFDEATANQVRAALRDLLRGFGFPARIAKRLARRWVRSDDFLLTEELGSFTDVVGNPPYMRWSRLPGHLRRLYEQRLPKFAARGDLCLAFVWRSVDLLQEGGRTAFLCADRWLRCSYGGSARVELAKVSRIALHLDVHDVPVFLGDRKVDAYAAITVLQRGLRGDARIARVSSLAALQRALSSADPVRSSSRELHFRGAAGVALVGGVHREVFEALCEGGTPLSDAGVHVRCGMALGYAPAFVLPKGSHAVEPERQLPWIQTRDLSDDGTVHPSASLVNVWDGDGDLIKLSAYPRLAAHLRKHRNELLMRACVSSNQRTWFRTIDRSSPTHVSQAKILIAGLSKRSRVALSPGGAQHSNAIYSLTSDLWPLTALFALFRTGILDLFAAALAPRFSGGALRFDGNVLRQVRVPAWRSVDADLKDVLLRLTPDMARRSPNVLADLYGIKMKRQRTAIASFVSNLTKSQDEDARRSER